MRAEQSLSPTTMMLGVILQDPTTMGDQAQSPQITRSDTEAITTIQALVCITSGRDITTPNGVGS